MRHTHSPRNQLNGQLESHYGKAAGPVPAELHGRGSHGSNVGLVELGVPRLGFEAIPLGSGTVVVVVDVEVELAANSTMIDIIDVVVDVYAEVPAFTVVAVVATVGFKVSPVPVWTVTREPGVTSDGLYPMLAGPSI